MEIILNYLGFLSCAVEIILSIYFFKAFGNFKYKRKIVIPLIITFYILYSLSLFFIKNTAVVFIISIVITFCVSLLFDFKIFNKILLSIIISIISSISEFIVAIIIGLFNTDIKFANNSIFSYLVGLLFSKFITYLIILLIYKSKHKLMNEVSNLNMIYLIILPISTIFVIISQYEFILNEKHIPLMILSTAGLFLLIISNILIFHIIDRQNELIVIREKLNASKKLLKVQADYYDELIDSEKELRKIRHNLKSLFLGLKSMLQKNQINSVIEKIDENLSEIDKQIITTSGCSSILDIVLLSKSKLSQSKGITITSNKKILSAIKMEDVDQAVLFSNILDNAIEAAENEIFKAIEINVYSDNDNFIFKCSNPCSANINVDNLNTTKIDEKNHGFGILSIKSIVEKYHGEYVFSRNDNIFNISLIIPNIDT